MFFYSANVFDTVNHSICEVRQLPKWKFTSILFLIYINDIRKLPLKGILKLFADDCALFYFSHSVKDNLQNRDLILLETYYNKFWYYIQQGHIFIFIQCSNVQIY